ncbi:MAG TPA: hypothetical protein VFP56_06230, partial [Candidatus Limnocylindrales bacterium]|nr:hypothetical protein [Candidatus Limnocylindrales bacterium]
ASLARRFLRDGAACGLLLGTQLAGGRRWAYLPPTTAPGQLGRLEDLLARVRPIVSLPFEQLLGVVPRRLPPGGTVVVLSARDPTPYVNELRRLSRSGYEVRHMAMGPDRAGHHGSAVRAGVAGSEADLNPSWREADALVVAG